MGKYRHGIFKKVICRKSFVFPTGQGVAKYAEYGVKDFFIDDKLSEDYAVYNDTTSDRSTNFIGYIEKRYFMTLAEFRDIRINQIFED
jgi:hypothetical protein